jgi:hypothetical protein
MLDRCLKDRVHLKVPTHEGGTNDGATYGFLALNGVENVAYPHYKFYEAPP